MGHVKHLDGGKAFLLVGLNKSKQKGLKLIQLQRVNITFIMEARTYITMFKIPKYLIPVVTDLRH